MNSNMIITKPTHSATRTATWVLTGSIDRDATPQSIEVNKSPFRIGRRRDIELSLVSRVISNLHAELIQTAGILCVRDLNSTNGTFVNGNRISSDTLLSEGDWIEIGHIHLRVELRRGPEESSSDRFTKTRLFNAQNRSEAKKALHTLISTRGLGPCFQPIHNIGDKDIHGYEFLARSNVEGVNTPALMFQAAELAGREIELSMLCRDVGVDHSICLPARLPLFLNTHPAEPLLESVVPQMRELRQKFPLRPLVLEIHEGAVTEPELVRKVRASLADFDVQLAFDDFGAGKARLRELICAPSDYIKFDASLIRDLQEVSTEKLGLFRAIIKGVREEGALTVAEGVETEEMIAICEEVGFDLLQGYAMSRPAIMYPDIAINPNDTATIH